MSAALKRIHASLDALESRVCDADFDMEQAVDDLRARIDQASLRQVCDYYQTKTILHGFAGSRYYDQKLHLNIIMETHAQSLAVALKETKNHAYDRRLDALLLRYYHTAFRRPAAAGGEAKAAALVLRAFRRFPDDPLVAEASAALPPSALHPWSASALRFVHEQTRRIPGLSGPISLAFLDGSMVVAAVNPPHLFKMTGDAVETPQTPLNANPIFMLRVGPDRLWLFDWVAWAAVELDPALRVVRTLPVPRPESVRGAAHIGGAVLHDQVYLSIVDQYLWETHLVAMDRRSGRSRYLERVDGMATFHADGDVLYCTDCFRKTVSRYSDRMEPLFSAGDIAPGVNMEAASHGKGGFLLYGGEKVVKIDSRGRIVHLFDLSRITGRFGLIQWGGLAVHDGRVYVADYFNNTVSTFDLGD